MDSVIPPLTKRDKDNVRYTRVAKVEARIKQLIALPPDLIVEQVKIAEAENPDYVSSEAIIHLLRWKRVPENHSGFRSIWDTLVARVLPKSDARPTQRLLSQAEMIPFETTSSTAW